MGYDVHLEADLGGATPVQLKIPDISCTYSIYPMLEAAGSDCPLNWNGIIASEVQAKCLAILEAFDTDPGKFQPDNLKNCWGNFECAYKFIKAIADACKMAPLAKVVVS